MPDRGTDRRYSWYEMILLSLMQTSVISIIWYWISEIRVIRNRQETNFLRMCSHNIVAGMDPTPDIQQSIHQILRTASMWHVLCYILILCWLLPRSRRNPKRVRDCVSSVTGQTGQTFYYFCQHLKTARPRAFFGEMVAWSIGNIM